MGVFTFICKVSGDEWSAKQHKGDLEASASCTYDLQRKLVQVIIGGGGGFIGGGAAAAASSGGAAAAEAAPAEEKKEEKEESDDDMGLSLFD